MLFLEACKGPESHMPSVGQKKVLWRLPGSQLPKNRLLESWSSSHLLEWSSNILATMAPSCNCGNYHLILHVLWALPGTFSDTPQGHPRRRYTHNVVMSLWVNLGYLLNNMKYNEITRCSIHFIRMNMHIHIYIYVPWSKDGTWGCYGSWSSTPSWESTHNSLI